MGACEKINDVFLEKTAIVNQKSFQHRIVLCYLLGGALKNRAQSQTIATMFTSQCVFRVR